MMSSSATTVAVTASSVTLAPAKEFAMSAPNAGPPVTSACSPSGRRSAVWVRRSTTASLSANPDRSADNEETDTAASPSSDTWAPGPAAATSAGLNGAPSVLVNTMIAGAVSPPGNSARSASTRADSDSAGTATGDWDAASEPLIRPRPAPEIRITSSATSQETRRDMPQIFQILNH